MAGWKPPRPERLPIAWQEPTVRPISRFPPNDASAFDREPESAPRRARRRSSLSPTRQVVLALAALLLAIASITGIGTALMPVYGGLTPYGTTAVADLRTTPTADGWSTNLARTVLPGVPVRCAEFASSQATGRYVVVTSTAPPLGSTSNCAQGSLSQVQSTVALLDSSTGRILWSVDLARSFPSRSGTVVLDSETVVPAAHRVLVELTVDDLSAFASLSMSTGRVTSSTILDEGATGDLPTIMGKLVLYGGSVAREGSTQWTLADATRVDKPLWSAVLDDATPPVLTARAAFARIDGTSSRIDGTTGRVTKLGDGRVDLTDAVYDADGMLTTQTVPSGTVISAWNDAGTEVWSRGGVGVLAGLTRDCVMVALPGTSKGTCLDRATGRSRWTTDIATGSYAYAVPGQTNDDVMIYRNKGDETELDIYDGATGRLKFPIVLPPVSFTTISSRTAGYLQVDSDSGTPTGITAFDTTSGRQLWTIAESQTRDTSFWGGQLVRVSRDGVATQLTDQTHRVLHE